MKKEFETEVRGPLTKDSYKQLIKLFEDKGEPKGSKNRILIDYSTFLAGEEMEGRQRDIRLRVTNGEPEIMIKLGGWGGNEQREELSIKAQRGDFDSLVRVFDALGYSKGMLCMRNTKVFMYKDIEFALVEIPGETPIYTYEAEKVTSSDAQKDQILGEIINVCQELQLETYTDDEFFTFVKKLNEDVNEVFDYANYEDGYFKKRFGL